MELKPEIEAEITVLPYEVNLRRSALRDDIVGYYECPIVLPNGTWDCRMVFPDADGRVELGQTATALIRFLNPNEALQGLNLGDNFQLLKENETIATGKVTRFIVAAISHELKLEFIGSSREYFRIWAVNLCLTLLTLGIFSAWAKVRKKRYFYSHTILDGTPFQYLGQPMPILKGRIIGATLFTVYYVSSHFLTSLLPYVLALGAVLAPWVAEPHSVPDLRSDSHTTGLLRSFFCCCRDRIVRLAAGNDCLGRSSDQSAGILASPEGSDH